MSPKESADVLVLGGGIIGLACARELAGRGLKVELLERLPAGAEASTAAAGMLTPLAEVPRPGPFFEACRQSRDLWPSWVAELAEESGVAVEHDASGALVIALNAEEEEALVGLERAAAELGEPVVHVDLASLHRSVPDLAPVVERARLFPGEHRVDNVQACAALAVAAARRGVVLHYGAEVLQVEVSGSGVKVMGKDWQRSAGHLVLAAGAWSGGIPGLPALPVRPVRGQMLLLGGVEWHWNGIVRGPHFYTVRRGATGLLAGATVEEAGFVKASTVSGVGDLLSDLRRLFPGSGGYRLETAWASFRPGTPDGLPLLGSLSGSPILAATGHYRNGILLAPWTARQVADLLTAAALPLPAFSPARFDL
ncbi:MAG TPA: glycine oxidase ThiO [Thermoanaerobaculia bacterium]|nr:glycine oxidase ThiO [Thermoanaerobaculia bacterium]